MVKAGTILDVHYLAQIMDDIEIKFGAKPGSRRTRARN